MIARKDKSPKFPLGRIVATPGALEALEDAGQSASDFLQRHAVGDWGDVRQEDWNLNDEAVKDGSRLLSSYQTAKGVKIWIITEAADEGGQRTATTLLLPEEY